ncbi:MAG TPA: DUF1799 domain-containing protein [Azonexus sp.]|nr:DUF1799 domain-containing protein [Azonexus sp.]
MEAQSWLDAAAEGQEQSYGLWPDNWPAFSLFLDLKTQWRPGPMGGVLGLDYAAIAPTMDLRGIKRKRRGDLFDALQAMEAAVLQVVAEK